MLTMDFAQSHMFIQYFELTGGPFHAVMGPLEGFVLVLIKLDVG
jgi:hypothetical protein